MGAFWEHGYEATSLAKLLAVTGLSESSLYAAFGDKHQLFVAAFDLYRDRQLEHLTKILNAHSAPQGIRAFFEEVIGVGLEACQRFGCMSTNQAAELALSDGVVSNRVAEDHRRLEDAFTDTSAPDKTRGPSLRTSMCRVAASALVTAYSGFQLTVRAGIDRAPAGTVLAYLMAPLEVAAN